jgi:glycerate-2-kinase
MSVILNRKKLASSPLRKDAVKIIESAYNAIDIEKLTAKRFKVVGDYLGVNDLARKEKIHLTEYKKIYVIGFGKGSIATVSVMADKLDSRLSAAIALDVKSSYVPKKINKKVKTYFGTHPQPSLINVKATSKIINLAKNAGEKDLIIYFVGGGGSSLLCGSSGELKFASTLFKRLTTEGATIEEINTVRKHISEVKGGNLAKFTYPATSLSLIVSDVCGNSIETIASGPTVYDKTTVEDAIKILEKYKISLKGDVFIETPKDKHFFDRCKYFLLACNQDAVLAMIAEGRKLGYKSSIGSLMVVGEAKSVIFPFIKKIKKGQMLALAGETTVKIKGDGKGGRNQELSLSVIAEAFRKKIDISDLLVVSFASDGYDNTPVAGAFADEISLEKSIKRKLNLAKYLNNNDSYSFFKKIDDYVRVERRSFNVADLMLIIKR